MRASPLQCTMLTRGTAAACQRVVVWSWTLSFPFPWRRNGGLPPEVS
jgi:hypothetical protein